MTVCQIAKITGCRVIGIAGSDENNEYLWRRKNARLDETDVAAVPGTDILCSVLKTVKKRGWRRRT